MSDVVGQLVASAVAFVALVMGFLVMAGVWLSAVFAVWFAIGFMVTAWQRTFG